jgi:hypothetical protein
MVILLASLNLWCGFVIPSLLCGLALEGMAGDGAGPGWQGVSSLLDAGACWSGDEAGMLGDADDDHDEEERGKGRAGENASNTGVSRGMSAIKLNEAMSPVGFTLASPWGKGTQPKTKGGGAVVNTRAPIRQAVAAEASHVADTEDGDWT